MRNYYILAATFLTALVPSNVAAQDELGTIWMEHAQQQTQNYISIHVQGLAREAALDEQRAEDVRSGTGVGNDDQPKVTPPVLSKDQAYKALGFTPNAAVRKKILDDFVGAMRKSSPDNAAQLEQTLKSVNFYAEFDKSLADVGMTSSNVVDVQAVWMVNIWSAARGDLSITSQQTVKAVRDQLLEKFATNMDITKWSASDKQQYADPMTFNTIMFAGATLGYANDPAGLKQFSRSMRTYAKLQGLDVDEIKLTPTGFVAAK